MISETLNTRGFNVIASSGDAKDSVSLCENYSYDWCARFNIYRQGKS